ncbi:MAG: MBL fold metallo-hydrolase [Promethearchaeota archaeon]
MKKSNTDRSTRKKAIENLYSMLLRDDELAFIFLGYSGILLRTKDTAIAFDPGKGLGLHEISALEYLDLLVFSHNHWDHYNLDFAVKIFTKTNAHIVADSISYNELADKIPPEKLTLGNPGISGKMYESEGHKITALPGIHVGPQSQYLVHSGEYRIFHGGDSGYWRHKNHVADIAFVPTGTATTCAPEVALAMVMDLKPRTVVAIHGNSQDKREFRVLMSKVCPDIELLLPEQFTPIRMLVRRGDV